MQYQDFEPIPFQMFPNIMHIRWSEHMSKTNVQRRAKVLQQWDSSYGGAGNVAYVSRLHE